MTLPIYSYGHPILRQKTNEIDANYPDLKSLVDKMWSALGEDRQSKFTPKGNRKGINPKRLLMVLLIDLYATYLDDPTVWTGVGRSWKDYTPSSRYNSHNIS